MDDEDHVEKAFDFAGMGARNGVMAVTMVEEGMTGVSDVLDGNHNLFVALSTEPKFEAMLEGASRWQTNLAPRRNRGSDSDRWKPG